ncbi:hypothetical protein ACE198_18670 [Neobacillus sp. KR4-4]|uniref:hypothetical protein n=1 Tax=Neobacillus sp. KR4-4 TaxID=3344872 RepID=UPI0035CBA673
MGNTIVKRHLAEGLCLQEHAISKKLRPMSEEFVSIEDVTSEESGTEEQIG